MWHKLPIGSAGAAENAAPLLIHGVILRSKWRDMEFEEKLTAKLDTAASISAIPHETAIKMKLPSAGTADGLQSFDRSIAAKPYPKFFVNFFIPQWGWHAMPVIGCPREDILFGRDMLKGNLLLVNWRCGFGIRSAKTWHRPLELLFKRRRPKKM